MMQAQRKEEPNSRLHKSGRVRPPARAACPARSAADQLDSKSPRHALQRLAKAQRTMSVALAASDVAKAAPGHFVMRSLHQYPLALQERACSCHALPRSQPGSTPCPVPQGLPSAALPVESSGPTSSGLTCSGQLIDPGRFAHSSAVGSVQSVSLRLYTWLCAQWRDSCEMIACRHLRVARGMPQKHYVLRDLSRLPSLPMSHPVVYLHSRMAPKRKAPRGVACLCFAHAQRCERPRWQIPSRVQAEVRDCGVAAKRRVAQGSVRGFVAKAADRCCRRGAGSHDADAERVGLFIGELPVEERAGGHHARELHAVKPPAAPRPLTTRAPRAQ